MDLGHPDTTVAPNERDLTLLALGDLLNGMAEDNFPEHLAGSYVQLRDLAAALKTTATAPYEQVLANDLARVAPADSMTQEISETLRGLAQRCHDMVEHKPERRDSTPLPPGGHHG